MKSTCLVYNLLRMERTNRSQIESQVTSNWCIHLEVVGAVFLPAAMYIETCLVP